MAPQWAAARYVGQLVVAGNLDALHPVEVEAGDDLIDPVGIGFDVGQLDGHDVAVHMHPGDPAAGEQPSGQLVGRRGPRNLVSGAVALVAHAG